MNIQAKKQEIINTIEQLQSKDVLERLSHFLHLSPMGKKGNNALTQKEADLLILINSGLPEVTQLRYNELNQKLVEETITKEEHQELLTLISQIEHQNVERLRHLYQLSKLWNLSVDQTMNRLGIKSPPALHA